MDIAYIPRQRDRDVAEFLSRREAHKNVLLVEGARQVGKTSLVVHALSRNPGQSIRINLERERRMRVMIDECVDFREFEELLQDRYGFVGDQGMTLFIDEAQESERLGGFVRFMKENWPLASVVLSGSSLRRLFREKVRYPVGRVQRLLLGPFSFAEYLTATGNLHLAQLVNEQAPEISTSRHAHLLSLYDQFLLIGGLPAVVTQAAGDEHRANEMRAEIMADYEEGFRRVFGEETAHIASLCLRSVANHVGSVSKNTSVIESPSGHLSNRISEVFARLERWHFILHSEQMSMSPEKSHKYLPKRYLFDTGLLRMLREAAVPAINILSTVDSASRQPLGGVIENQTAIALYREFGEVQGWKKSSSGGEVDFVIRRKPYTYPVECKAALKMSGRHLKGLRQYLDITGMKLGFVVSLAPWEEFDFDDGKRIVNLPAYSIGAIVNYDVR